MEGQRRRVRMASSRVIVRSVRPRWGGLSHSGWKVSPVAAMKQKRSLMKFLWVNSLRSGIRLGLWVALWAW